MPRVRCPDCDGSDDWAGLWGNGVCSRCHGDGFEPGGGPPAVILEAITGQRDPCQKCGGNGQCKTCGGEGQIERGEEATDHDTSRKRPIPQELDGEDDRERSDSSGDSRRDDHDFSSEDDSSGAGSPDTYASGTGTGRDESHSGYSSGDDYSGGRSSRRYSRKSRRSRRSSRGYSGGGSYSYSPSSGSPSTDSSSSDGTDEAAARVAGLVILGLLIWMSTCVVRSIRTQHPYESETPTISSPGQARPLQLGIVAACSAVRAWRDYTPQSRFLPGDEVLIYGEALDINQDGKIDVAFDYAIVAPNGTTIATASVPVSIASTNPSYATWQRFRLPPNAPPGTYTATAVVRDNLTGQRGSHSVTFTVSSMLGTVATSSVAQRWGDYTPQSQFVPGDHLLIYAEAIDVNHDGNISVVFDDKILAPGGAQIANGTIPVSVISKDSSWATWPSFTIPSDAPPGSYMATVVVRDNLTGNTGSKSVMFTVSVLSQSPTEEVDGTVTDPVGDAQMWPGVSVSPDLVFANATAAGGVLAMHIRFAPGTFDPERTQISIALDTDRDPSTGYHGFYPYAFDSNVLGADYMINIVASGRVASVNRCGGLLGNRCAGVSSTTLGVSPDEIGLSVPLPILHSNGKVNFKVCVSSFVPDKGYTPYLDCMPDKGLPPATSVVQ